MTTTTKPIDEHDKRGGRLGREREIPNDIKLLSLRYEMKRKLHAYEIFRQMMLGANQSHE